MPLTLANPTPLGLITFGLSTILLSLVNAGILDNGAQVMAQALFVGGLAQMLSGVMEFFRGNTFGCVVFTSFGGFWISVAAFDILPKLGWAEPGSAGLVGTFMLIWSIYVFLLFLAVYKGGVLALVVGSLTLLLLILAVGTYSGSSAIIKVAGYEGVICGGSALYLGCAITLEETAGKKILPY
ncbi:MAG: acetate uptake transporter [Deltaproteobacteria bacterium]|jgi:succinate-acetate transporter protein|nr:acetate uptake transporter [Deltaproteobacteria bacterium]